jgi:hypothetical protein
VLGLWGGRCIEAGGWDCIVTITVNVFNRHSELLPIEDLQNS